MFTFDFVFSISQGTKQTLFFEDVGGGCMVAISSPSPICYRLPIYNFVSCDHE